ncbi:lytic transglycosylase domain-containing protein [Nitratireductor sp. ZSWI3]|uniref:lytic transglycosylase domain-containing protein n=1 Tax=Nitratireductor sp. ZSWI3 TaxID=2966359 RepID=UPI00214FBA78|nr:lytic transglycosylase domain-containing protein [Nitratireductor sp. ZSWI3]MCR4268410.1 lytic transglycosylase domain-containing protein [Nitratireductor sp. ZSWI3]
MARPRRQHASGRRLAARRIALLLLSGLPLLVSPDATAFAQPAPATATPASHPYAAHIAEAAQRFGIPEHWIAAVLRAESAGDIRAISSAGAMGLMQVMPDTWAELRARYRLGRDPYDARDNILAGAAYLREMWDRYGNVAAMLAAYNAGPARYDDYLATGRTLPAETRAYVATLVPDLGGHLASDPPPPVSPPPPDWREAPLFVMRSGGTQGADARSSEAQSGDAPTPVPVRDTADAEPQDGSVFVARASDGSTP